MSKPFSIESIKGYPREECEIAQKIMNKYNKKCMPLIGPSSIGSVSYMFAKFGPFKDVDDFILCILLPAFFGAISLVVMLFNIYEYIGWKYAPEIKTIEYIMWLFKN